MQMLVDLSIALRFEFVLENSKARLDTIWNNFTGLCERAASFCAAISPGEVSFAQAMMTRARDTARVFRGGA